MLKFRTKCTVRKNDCGLLRRVKFVTEADREGTLERFVNLDTSLTQNCPISHLFTWCGMTNRYECLCTSTIVLPPKVVKCEKLTVLRVSSINVNDDPLDLTFVKMELELVTPRSWRLLLPEEAGVTRSSKAETHLEMTFLLRPLVVSFMQLTALLGWVSMLHLYVHCTEMSSSERVF